MTRVAGALVVAALALSACGYAPLRAASGARLAVVAAPALVSDASVVAEAIAGARAALAEAGALGEGGAAPRLVVEVLREDVASEGVAVADGAPLARGARVTVVGRAFVESAEGARERDTGDLRAVAVVGGQVDAPRALLATRDAARAAARLLGRRLARRALGLPAGSDDGG